MTGGKSDGRIIKKVWIKASTAVVYNALTQPRELIQWFCDRVSCDPREGGEFVAHWRDAGRKGRGVITRLVPGAAFELLWTDDGTETADNAKHTLSYEIHAKSGMTELVMVDKDESASDPDGIADVDQVWNHVLMELKEYCERKERAAKLRPQTKPGRNDVAAE